MEFFRHKYPDGRPNGRIAASCARNGNSYRQIGKRKTASCTVTVVAPSVKPAVPGTNDKEAVVVEPEVKNNARSRHDQGSRFKCKTGRSGSGKGRCEELCGRRISAGVLEEAARSAADGGAKMLVLAVTDGNGTVLASAALDLAKVDPKKLLDVNFGFTNEVSDEIARLAKAAVPEDANIMFIHLAHTGAFPCPVTRVDYVGGNFREVRYTLYWIGPSGGLSEEQELVVDENGYIIYTISHASPYAVSDRKMRAMEQGTPEDTGAGTNDADHKRNPEPGSVKQPQQKQGDESDGLLYLWLPRPWRGGYGRRASWETPPGRQIKSRSLKKRAEAPSFLANPEKV